MIAKQLDKLPNSTIFVCKRCRTLYWNHLPRNELFIKKNGVIECPSCKRTNIFNYPSKEKLIEEINQDISELERSKRKNYEKYILDLNFLKNYLTKNIQEGVR